MSVELKYVTVAYRSLKTKHKIFQEKKTWDSCLAFQK